MKSRRKLKQDLETLKYIKTVLSSYEQLASMRIRKAKDIVLQNREFLEGLQKVFYQVKMSYKNEVPHKKNVAEFRKTNGKNVSVFLSANTGLYGDILLRTFDVFKAHVMSTVSDIAIVGSVGKNLFAGYEGDLKEGCTVKYLPLADSQDDPKNLADLLDYITKYDKIIVFHGRFKDILVQDPAAVSISGDIFSTDTTEVTESPEIIVRYIFEPAVEEILHYFEKEILSSIFEQSVQESNLSKNASRMVSLDQASNRVDKMIEKQNLIYERTYHKMQSDRQLNILAGLYARHRL